MRLKALALVALLTLGLLPVAAQEGTEELTLTPIGTYTTGLFDEGASEIAAYDPATMTLFVSNGATSTLDLLNISDPAAPTLITEIDMTEYGDVANSVAVYGDLVAVSVDADEDGANGAVVFFSTTGEFISSVEVGVIPDMVTFTPDGSRVLVANEGEPNDDYSIDAEGSVSIIDVSGGAAGLTADNVTTVGFTDFNEGGTRASELPAEVRIFGPNATVAQDLEPEYITVSPDGAFAFVTLQENNAVAAIDITNGTVAGILWLGAKDHSAEGNGLDYNNDDGEINITTAPVFGLYMPDAIAAYEANGGLYLVTANEGDTRDYETYSEEADFAEITLDAEAFPNAAELQSEDMLGNLEVLVSSGDADGDGDYEAVYIPGGRSFTIWNVADGSIVFDSGDDFEQITAAADPDNFNSTNDENGSFDDRSDNKGPEPEGLALGVVGESTYAFIGLERVGGVMVYNITDPAAPVFVTYANNRDFSGNPEEGTAGDLGPEGLLFISAENSPNGSPLLVVTNEISGSTTIYEIGGME